MGIINKDKEEKLITEVELREDFLSDIIQSTYVKKSYYVQRKTEFLIARKWNSWFPGYFKVDGGCYAIITGDAEEDREKNAGVIVIDPGYRFLEILRRDFNIEPQDINKVIVTHYHPDHMAGLIEYINLRIESCSPCDIYLNESTYIPYKNMQNKFVSIHEINPGQIIELASYKCKDGTPEKIILKVKKAYHEEAGHRYRSLGLNLEISTFINHSKESTYQIGILGDTDGHEDYIKSYVDDYSGVDLLILHLGTFSNKKWGKGGGHLCIKGINQILDQMQCTKEQKCTVVLSEFGLELGTKNQIFNQLEPHINNYSWRLPLILTYVNLFLEKTGDFYLDMYGKTTLHFFQQIIKEKVNFEKRDKLLCALGFITTAVTKELGEANMSKVAEEIKEYIKKYYKQRGAPPGNLEQFYKFKDKCEPEFLNRLTEFFRDFLQRNLKNVRDIKDKKIEESQKEILEVITHFTEIMGEQCIRALTSEFREMRYLLIWDCVFRFAQSIGVIKEKETEWLFKYQDVVDYDKFFTAVMLGLLVLQEEKERIEKETFPSPVREKNPLIEIARIFQETYKDYTILIGDIGCTFKFDKGIMTKVKKKDTINMTEEIIWLPPEKVKLSYDEEKGRIIYVPLDYTA